MQAPLGSWCQFVAAVAIAVVSGCGSGGENLPRQAASGTVTLDGKPLPSGSISFQPTGEGQPATQADAPISDGKFEIPRAQGLVPGKYAVRITTVVTATAEGGVPGEAYPKTAKEIIPKKYNAASTLTAEVVGGGAKTFDFTLESK